MNRSIVVAFLLSVFASCTSDGASDDDAALGGPHDGTWRVERFGCLAGCEGSTEAPPFTTLEVDLGYMLGVSDGGGEIEFRTGFYDLGTDTTCMHGRAKAPSRLIFEFCGARGSDALTGHITMDDTRIFRAVILRE